MPDGAQAQIVEHLRQYIEEMGDGLKGGAQSKSTQSRPGASTRRSRKKTDTPAENKVSSQPVAYVRELSNGDFCAFCFKTSEEVRFTFTGGINTTICNECVAVATLAFLNQNMFDKIAKRNS